MYVFRRSTAAHCDNKLTRAPARRSHKRPRSSRSSPEVETASAGCCKCVELFPFLTQKLGDITTQLTQLTRTSRRVDARMAVKAHLVALVQAPAAAVVEQVRRGALLEVRKNLAHEVTEMI